MRNTYRGILGSCHPCSAPTPPWRPYEKFSCDITDQHGGTDATLQSSSVARGCLALTLTCISSCTVLEIPVSTPRVGTLRSDVLLTQGSLRLTFQSDVHLSSAPACPALNAWVTTWFSVP